MILMYDPPELPSFMRPNSRSRSSSVTAGGMDVHVEEANKIQ